MRKTLLAIGASLILALAAMLFMQQFRPTNAAVRVGLFMQGRTNDVSGKPVVIILLTNISERPIHRWGHFGVTTKLAAWQQNPQASMAASTTLQPGQVEILQVPVPTNGGPWKAVLFCSKEDWRIRANSRPFWVRLIPGLDHGIPTETFLTEWIDN